MNRIALLIAAMILLGGCASGIARMKGETAGDRYRPYVGTAIESFNAFRLDGWELAGPNEVVIWTGLNQAYLVTVWSSCQDLAFTNHVGLPTTSRTVSRMDSLRVGRDRCPIESIRPIDIKRYKEDLALQREPK